MLPWLEKNLLPCYPNLTKEKPLILLMDGYGSHFTYEVLLWCRLHHIVIILRPPHTSHWLQGIIF